jgi:radical SAM protein with 4Fe4S-binding SPASM domain
MSQFWKGFDNIEEVQTKKFTHWSGVSDEVVKLHEDFEPSKRDKSYVACTQPWWNLTVLWDGRVVPCCGDVNGIYEYGNLQTSTLEEIWNNEKIQSLRKSFLENKVSNPLCKNCEYLYE